MDSISQFVRDECEQDSKHICAASKFYQAYRDWCCSAGRKPQSTTAFKRSLEKLKGVYQHRSSNGLKWHGIQPCLTYWCSRCRLCSPFWKLSTGISVGTFRIGLHSLHSLHSLHCFLLLREIGILIDHKNLVDTQPTPCRNFIFVAIEKPRMCNWPCITTLHTPYGPRPRGYKSIPLRVHIRVIQNG